MKKIYDVTELWLKFTSERPQPLHVNSIIIRDKTLNKTPKEPITFKHSIAGT